MRWSVEISQIGKGEVLEQLTLEAPNWQAALKQARDKRGEGNTLEGLSVEFLDDGCRAIDGANAIRYVVSKAPDAAVAPKTTEPVAGRKPIERPSTSRRALDDARPAPTASRTVIGSARPVTRKAADVPAHEPESAPEPEAAPEPGSPPEAPTFELLSTRTTPGTSRMPLAHHERAFGLLEPVSDAELEAFALARLAEVRAELVGAKSGNIVDIAVFQEPFDGRPTVPPIVTVRWCDWREIPEVRVDPYPDFDVAHGFDDDERAVRPTRPEPERPSRVVEPARPPSPSMPEPESVDEEIPAEEPAKRKVLPKALPKVTPLKAQTPAPAAAAPAAEPTKPKETAASRSASEDAPEPAGTPLTSRRPLGARSPIGSRPSTSAKPGAGPVAGSKPAGATLLGGGVDIKGARGKSEAGREPSDSAAATTSSSDGEDGDGEPPPAPRSTRSILTVDADRPEPRVVSASVGGFERTRRHATAASVGASAGGRELSREEKEARHQSARLRASTVPPPEAREGKRVTGDELLSDLFEALSELPYVSDALEASALVLAVALEKLPSQVGMVSLFDLDRREFVVVRQEGGRRSSLLLRAPETSAFPDEAMRARRAIVVHESDDLDRGLDARWKDVGVAVTSLLCAPVDMAGRTLGVIELANPSDAEDYETGDANALGYIAKQFAEVLDARGVLLDPDAILAAAEVSPRR
jgi:hypothetical protein